MIFSQRHTVLLALFFVITLALGIEAGHLPSRSHRNAPYSGPKSFQTVQTIITPSGAITETCTITLTPIVGSDGENLVRQEKSCTFSTPALPSPDPEPTPTAAVPAVSTSAESTTFVSIPTAPVASSQSTSDSPAATPASTPTASPAPEEPEATTPSGPIVLGTSIVPAPTSAAPTPPIAAASIAPSAAAESISPSSTPFTLPGKSISILPIGLGIFAGISVIALAVVAVVTYERTKHRKAFRERKLAEAGAGMGYGGTGESRV